MRVRGLALAAALSLAAVATLTVFLYVRGVQTHQASTDDVAVVVAQQDIPAGSDLEDLASTGAFELTDVPKESVVRDAVTDMAQLDGQVSSAAILEGEQVSRARLQGNHTLPGGTLGIPKGYTAVTVALDSPRLAGGALQRGDHVTVYGTVSDVSGKGGQTSVGVTSNLAPDVEVLKVQAPSSQNGSANSGLSLVTMALKPKDAQKIVFTQEQGTVYLALLPPGEKGKKSHSINLMEVL